MTKNLTIKEHLKKVRKLAHETMRKNGHYFRMVKAREKKRKLSTPKD